MGNSLAVDPCGYPDALSAITLELALNNRNEDLLRRDADIAVRMARPNQEGLVARRIGHVLLGLHAHRDYVARFGVRRTG